MLPFQALKVSLCMWKCTRTLPFPTHGNFETQITLSGIERSATDQPLSVIHHCRVSLTLCERKRVREGRRVWETCVKSMPRRGLEEARELVFFLQRRDHLFSCSPCSLSFALRSPSLPLSVLLPGDFVINSTQLSGTLCPEFPLTVTPFSLNLHLWHSSPPSTDQHKGAPLLVTRPGKRNEESC